MLELTAEQWANSVTARLTDGQTAWIKARCKSNEAWPELVEHCPKFVAAIEALPDESLMEFVNSIMRDVFADMKREACAVLPAESEPPDAE